MDFGSSLPFAPHLYELRLSSPVSDGTLFRVVAGDNKRVYLRIARLSGPIAPGASWTFNGFGGANGTILANTDNVLELNFAIHSTLTCAEVFSNGYGGGTVFSVIEVLYNLPSKKESYNDSKKPRSLADKIKDFVLSDIRFSRGNNGRNTIEPKT